MNTPLIDALKPCPFCGNTPSFEHIEIDKNQGYKWGRVRCCIDGPEVRTNYDESENAPWKADAIAAWNTRANSPESSAAQGAMTDDLCEILSTVLHFIPREEARLSDDIHAMCGKLRAAQPSDATAQPINTDDMNDRVLRGLASLNEQEAGDLLSEMAEVAQPRVDLTDERYPVVPMPVGLAVTDTDSARHYLIKFMAENFDDRTFLRYIRDDLAGDFAFNLAKALANTTQGKPCQKFEYNPEHTDHCDFCKCSRSDHALAAKKG